MPENNYGSGSFGSWITDEWGLPAYEYTCDQYHLEEKMPFVNKDSIWGDYRSHWSQIGNDRIIGLTSNFGYIRIRQDEGAPKLLNDYVPERNQYAGGFGFLFDGKDCLSTFYHGQTGFRRVFGMGYFLKETGNDSFSVKEITFAPYGDDPVFLTRVTVTNHTDEVKQLKWYSYWGSEIYQFSSRPVQYQSAHDVRPDYPYYFRREFARNFERVFTAYEHGAGVKHRFAGWQYPEADKERNIASIQEVNQAIRPEIEPGVSYEDLDPPALYSFLLNQEETCSVSFSPHRLFADSAFCDYAGSGGQAENNEEENALILCTAFSLSPGESKELVFLTGYEPEGVSMDSMVKKYSACASDEPARTMMKWKEKQILFETDGSDAEKALKRELIWHGYFLRSSMTYDDAVHTHMLNQGCNYQYLHGFNIFVRDIAAHLLPFIYTDPAKAKEINDFLLRMVDRDGYIFTGLTGHGVLMQDPRSENREPASYITEAGTGTDPGESRADRRPPMEQRFDDLELWVLWAVCEYVLAVKDFDYLSERKTGCTSLNNTEPHTVLDLCKSLYRYVRNNIGVGKHGLIRLLWTDWSRVLKHRKARPVSPEDARTAPSIGESLYTSGLASVCLDLFADMLGQIGDPTAEEVCAFSGSLKEAVNHVFNGKWVPRIWVNDHHGFVGDQEEFFMEGNCWPLINDALTPEHAEALIRNMKELVIDPSPIGAMKQRKAPDYDGEENDGWIWWALNGPLMIGLTRYDPDLAYEQFLKMSMARHAEVYPDIWTGIWSADDQYTSILGEYPGTTRVSASARENLQHYLDGTPDDYEIADAVKWPIQCLHPHAWPLYTAVHFLCPNYTGAGISLTPSLPKEQYRIESPLLGYAQTETEIRGHYRPVRSGPVTVAIDLCRHPFSVQNLEVNGHPASFELHGTVLSFTGEADPELRWKIR